MKWTSFTSCVTTLRQPVNSLLVIYSHHPVNILYRQGSVKLRMAQSSDWLAHPMPNIMERYLPPLGDQLKSWISPQLLQKRCAMRTGSSFLIEHGRYKIDRKIYWSERLLGPIVWVKLASDNHATVVCVNFVEVIEAAPLSFEWIYFKLSYSLLLIFTGHVSACLSMTQQHAYTIAVEFDFKIETFLS